MPALYLHAALAAKELLVRLLLQLPAPEASAVTQREAAVDEGAASDEPQASPTVEVEPAPACSALRRPTRGTTTATSTGVGSEDKTGMEQTCPMLQQRKLHRRISSMQLRLLLWPQ